MQEAFIIHYHEIALKGRNRDFFEKQLVKNIKRSLGANFTVKRLYGRILVLPSKKVDLALVKEKLVKVFGIAYFAPAFISETDLDLGEKIIKPLGQEIWQLVEDKEFASFKVEVKRSNKTFPLKSPEMEKQLGEVVFEGFKEVRRVKMKDPELIIYLEIADKNIFIYLERILGPGGLPVGVSGQALCLLSSGFDSPVAAYKMAKRGVRVDFIHFHSYPYTNQASQENVKKLVKILNTYQYDGRLFNVAFGDWQKKVVANAPAKLRVVLYRRMMFRVAEKLAKKLGAIVLVTGDSVGQVASQTLENISAVSEAVALPILRPLVGEDKQEIINLAGKIGTHDISAQPYEDCCSMFVPQDPETKAKMFEIKKAEAEIITEPAVEEMFNSIKEEKI